MLIPSPERSRLICGLLQVQVLLGVLITWSFSSVGQSAPLITDGSGVQVPQGPFIIGTNVQRYLLPVETRCTIPLPITLKAGTNV